MRLRFCMLLLLPACFVQAFEVRFSGLTRTSAAALARRLHLERYRSLPPDVRAREQLASSARALGVFSEVRVEPVPGEDAVTLTVREKWTLFPFPFVSVSDTKTSYGAFVMEMNFLGLLKMLFAGAVFSADGVALMGGFIDPAVAGSRFSWSAFFRYSTDLLEDSTDTGAVYSRYEADIVSVTGTFGYALARGGVLSVYGEYRDVAVGSGGAPLAPPPSAGMFFAGMRLRIDRQFFRSWFGEGLRVQALATGARSLTAGVADGHRLEVTGQYDLALGRSVRLGMLATGGSARVPDALLTRIGGKPGFATLPQQTLAARDWWSLQLQAEGAFWRPGRATFTALVMAEAGQYAREPGAWQSFCGPGVGVRLYLQRLALPAMGLNTGWNVTSGELCTGFAVGMQL